MSVCLTLALSVFPALGFASTEMDSVGGSRCVRIQCAFVRSAEDT